MPRRANNRVGVEVVDSVPGQKGDEEPHADSSRDSFVDGASQMKSSASAQSLEAAKAQRQKELLRKKKAERRAHAKQRAAEKEQRQEEKKQKRELLRMMDEDVPAVEPINLVTRIGTSTSVDFVEGGDKALDATEPDALAEAQQDMPEISPLENGTKSPTLAEADGVQTAEHSAREREDYSSTTETIPKKRSGSSQPAKSTNAAALTIQKALKKNYKKCKTMFRQSPRVFAEEMATPSLSIPIETHPDCDATASEPVELCPEIAMDTALRGPPAECIVDASPFPVQFIKPAPIVPPLQLPPADPSSPVPRSRSSTASSCSSSCSCSDSGSCSSYSCSCSSSSSSSSLNSRSSDEDRKPRRRSKHRSHTDRSSHDHRRHTARTSRTHSPRRSGPSSSMLPEFHQQQSSGNVGKKYGEVHHYMAIRIQALVRGYRGRVRARQRQAELDQELREEALQELQQEACLKIQSRARGVLVRKKMPISDKERRRRRRRRQSQLHDNEATSASPGSPRSDDDAGMGVYEDPDEIGEWPEEIDLEALDDWQQLNQPASTLGDSVTQARFLSLGKLRVFCGTWNMHAKKPTDDLRLWIRLNKYHIVAIGSEECVNSIAKSVVFTSKKSWEDQLRGSLGDDYILVASHALTAIHNIVFVHASVLPLLGNIQSDAIATGLGNQLGNKGGVGVAFTVGATSFAFINSHFDAHQRNVSKRNGNFHRINHELRLAPTGAVSSPKNSVAVAPNPGSPNGANLQGLGRTSANRFSMPTVAVGGAAGSKRTISERFDRVFWYGDLNYRINGTRRMVDTLLLRNQHDVLYANDQLQREMKAGNVFAHFREGQLHFRPTYKFDKRSDVYDSSSKQRIPSWTDRVLYLSNDKVGDIELLNYRSQTSFRTSDHRPVSAIFQVTFNAVGTVGSLKSPRRANSSQDNGQSRENHVSSQTCTIQ